VIRKLGIIGGMSWESSAVYYRLLNQGVSARLGGLASARLVLSSVEFGALAAQMAAGRWDTVSATLVHEARALEAAGAEAILIASNTLHIVAQDVIAATGVPLLHIADGLCRRDHGEGLHSAPAARHAVYDGSAVLPGLSAREARHPNPRAGKSGAG